MVISIYFDGNKQILSLFVDGVNARNDEEVALPEAHARVRRGAGARGKRARWCCAGAGCTPGQSQTNNCYGNATTCHPPTPQPTTLGLGLGLGLLSSSPVCLRPSRIHLSLLLLACCLSLCSPHAAQPPTQPARTRRSPSPALRFASLRIGGETSLFPPGFPVC
jgi:hypothetical protein